MNEKRQRGGKAFHSILEPHFEFIRQQRQRRKTWQEIAELLFAERGIRLTLYAPYHFYRRKLRRAKRLHWEDDPVLSQPTHPNVAANRPDPGKPILAATPVARPFRQPNSENVSLNDPTKV